ncbi:TBC1 domain family member 9-like [Agrilus planipennis]|uniref:TBC1 domain family member 9-like n=1 Tax=Agrilus planipennis TaxID=224129 RepID=A0A7F5R8R4_AGRPL|nr:TBC1 domain family member 9-like [Agrilus planipennis]
MWVKPQEVLIANALWETEQSTEYFLLQHRKGHGNSKGISSLLVGTMDSIFDTKPPPFRILHQTPHSEVYYLIACSLYKQDIVNDWDWLNENIMGTLKSFDKEDDVTDFVTCKIESIIAAKQDQVEIEDEDTKDFKTTSEKFHRLFHFPLEEKLVNYYSCSYWKKFPRQGWMYLSLNYLCFHSYILGNDTKLCIRWSEIKNLEKSNSLIFPDSIKITTREGEYYFNMFLKKSETFALMDQLIDLAMKRLIDESKKFNEDKDLLYKLR